MAFLNNTNTIRFNATSIGTGPFVVASAYTGCTVPEVSGVIDGKTYQYYAQSADGLQYEFGFGVYTILTHTLTRVTIVATSNNDQNVVAFTVIPIVDVYPSSTSSLETNVAACRMSRRALQTLVAGTITKVLLDTVDFDTGGISNLANSKLIVPATGKYIISGNLYISGVTTGNLIDIWIFLNGANYVFTRSTVSPGGDSGMTAMDTGSFTIGDVFELYYFAGAGTPIFNVTGSLYPRLSLVRLS